MKFILCYLSREWLESANRYDSTDRWDSQSACREHALIGGKCLISKGFCPIVAIPKNSLTFTLTPPPLRHLPPNLVITLHILFFLLCIQDQ